MILETIDVCGVLAFKDPVHLDLRELPPGLIALWGANGQGKTTLLESAIAVLFRQFPTRKRKITDYATRPDAYIEVGFALEGRGSYRARLNLDYRGSSDATLTEVLPDGRLLPLNDGKLTTYDAEVAKLLPPVELLLASVFAAQNKAGSFVRLDKTGRRELFESLLGMALYREYEGRCRAATNAATQEIERLDARRSVLDRIGGDETGTQLETTLRDLGSKIQGARVALGEIEPAIARHREAIERYQGEAERHAGAKARHEALTRDLGRLQADKARVARDLAALPRAEADDNEKSRRTWSTYVDARRAQVKDTSELARDLRKIDDGEQRIIADADKRITENRTRLLDRAADIRAAVEKIASIEEVIGGKRRRIDEIRVALDENGRAERKVRAKLDAIVVKEIELRRAQDDAGLLEQVPCHGQSEFAGCQFLKNAQEAQGEIPALETAVQDKAAITDEILELARIARKFRDESEALAGDITVLEQAIVELRPLAKDADNLGLAEERIKGHEQRKADAAAAAQQARVDAQKREDARVERLQIEIREGEKSLARELRTNAENHEGRAKALKDEDVHLTRAIFEVAQHQALEAETIEATAAASAKLAEHRAEEAAVRAHLTDVTAQLSALTTQEQRALGELRAWEAYRDERRQLEGMIAELQADRVEWIALQKCFSREGLPVIEIDNAGPEIAATTNQLLEAAGISRFTVDIITQVAKASKGKDGSTTKETLEFTVMDSERGGEPRDLGDLSGGEHVFVDEAIKGAIAIYVNKRNPFPIRTCWRDETTGALDGENALRYMNMLRKQHELGGFHHTLFITHNPDARVIADAVIAVGGGQAVADLPPYEAVA